MALESPHFLTLPPEIRESIYKLILHPAANRLADDDQYVDYDYSDALVLFHVNRQVLYESRKIFHNLNVFVRIETPWPEASQYVAFEGHVPVMIRDERAASFNQHSLNVRIDAPHTPMQDADPQHFIILLDDLPLFTRTWFYSGLSHPELNRHLRLCLHIQDPYTPDWDEKRMPKPLQRRLLLPFGEVKELGDMAITGDPKPFQSIEAELRKEQAIRPESPEHCLREATRFKAEGNSELTACRYASALASYSRAWEAMHVVVKGRQRHIHADAHFSREMTEEPFQGKIGQSERLILRVQLVANTCLVYLKLEQWEELSFWGMRSINMMRDAMGVDERFDIRAEDEAVLGFPAADQMGKIYYRTALAYKAMDDTAKARRLLRVANVYLPRDESVKKEMSACALQIG